MGVFQRSYKDKITGEAKKTKTWWYKFQFAGQLIRESAGTTRKTLAEKAEKRRKLELERAIVGAADEPRVSRVRRVKDVVSEYLKAYPINHRPESVTFASGHLSRLVKRIGELMLSDLSEARIRKYIAARMEDGVSGRTINMELGELSRAIGKTWKELWPNVRKPEERKDVGRALSPEEESRLLDSAWQSNSPLIGPFVSVALLTGMRSGEILGMKWSQVDFGARLVTVGRAKTKAGSGRGIPMNSELLRIFEGHAQWFAANVAKLEADHYVFPKQRKGDIYDPSARMTNLSAIWDRTRKEAKVDCRFHDLRHCAATKLAEAGVSESTMMALMGHMSRAMIERYSHIRMTAKREAVESLTLSRLGPQKDEISNAVGPKVVPVGRIQ